MKEQSHLEEMRAAVRGDRERAEEARRRSSENVRAHIQPEPEAQRAPDPPAALEPPRARGLRRFLRLRR